VRAQINGVRSTKVLLLLFFVCAKVALDSLLAGGLGDVRVVELIPITITVCYSRGTYILLHSSRTGATVLTSMMF
jgi:hypothetical protein